LKPEYSTFDVAKGLKIERGRFREWVVNGYIKPSVKAAGAGTRAVFTLNDVYMTALFRHLLEYGFNRSTAGSFVKQFAERLELEKDRSNYPETVYIYFRSSIKNGQEISDVRRLGPGAWKFDIESGSIDWPLSNPKFKLTGKEVHIPPAFKKKKPIKDKTWIAVHMINMGELRREVDAAMERI